MDNVYSYALWAVVKKGMGVSMAQIKKWPVELQALLGNLLLAAVLILAVIYKDGGLFMPMYEYSASALPYTMFMNRAVHEGNLLWNFGLDLGGNVIESFSFYNLGSVLSWPLYLVPTSWVAGLMGPYLILKLGLAGCSTAHFLKRHLKDRAVILLTTFLYVFSGFTFSNLIIIYVVDAMVLFPMLVSSLEGLIEEKKKGHFILWVFLSAMGNIAMFTSEVVFLSMYVAIRYLFPYLHGIVLAQQEEQKDHLSLPLSGLRTVGTVLVELILGILLSGVFLVPAYYGIQQSGWLQNQITAEQYFTLFTQDWLLWLKTLCTPSEAMGHFSSVVMANFNGGQAYLPFFGMGFVIVYLISEKGWLRKLLILLLACSLFPVGNRLFYDFYNGDLRRWYFILVLFMALATGKVLENRGKYKVIPGLFLSMAILALYAGLTMLPLWYRWTEWGETKARLIYDGKLFVVVIGVTVVAHCLLLFLHRFAKKSFLPLVGLLTIGYCMGSFGVVMYGYHYVYDGEQLPFHQENLSYGENVYAYVTENPLSLDMDLLPYRVEYEEGLGQTYYNQALAAGVPTVSTCMDMQHSSLRPFYQTLGIGRGKGSPQLNEGLRDLLGVKYIYSKYPIEYLENRISEKDTSSAAQLTETPLVATLESGLSVYVYENPDALPIGCLYDRYITQSEYASLTEEEKQKALVSCVVVLDQDSWSMENTLMHQALTVNEEGNRVLDFSEEYGKVSPSVAYLAGQKQSTAMENFQLTDTGFTGTIHTEKDCVLLLTVPYDRYFEAYGNGVWLEVNNAGGIVAVKVPAGDSNIEMIYNYKPLKVGLAFFYMGVLLTFVYLGGNFRKGWLSK